jgi:hypothetical protein
LYLDQQKIDENGELLDWVDYTGNGEEIGDTSFIMSGLEPNSSLYSDIGSTVEFSSNHDFYWS